MQSVQMRCSIPAAAKVQGCRAVAGQSVAPEQSVEHDQNAACILA
jgi:hypothetical protein